MLPFLFRRLASAIVTLALATGVVFIAIHLLPGDPVAIMLGDQAGSDPVAVARVRAQLGLDLPLGTQFTHWASALARGDLGRKSGRGFYTWRDGKPVKDGHGGAQAPAGLAERLIQPLIDATRERVEAGVVADADLADAGVIFGTGFAPFTGGPLHYQSSRSA